MARASIGSLKVILTANTKALESGMKRAQVSVMTTTRAIGGAIKRMALAFAALGIAAGAALSVLVRRQMLAIDESSKLARSLGLTTKELAGLEIQAGLSGTNVQQMSVAMRTMQRRIGDAGRGLKTATDAFDKLGVSADDLRKMSAQEQMETLADAFGKLTNQVDRASLAQELFGRSGMAMLNVFEGGSDAMKRAREDAERFGYALNDIDARKVEVANDAMTRLRFAMAGVARTIAVQLAPLVMKLGDTLVNMSLRARESGQSILRVFSMASSAAAFLADTLELVKAAFYGLQFAATASITAIVDLTAWAAGQLKRIAPDWFTGFSEGVDLLSENLWQSSFDAMDAMTRAFENFRTGAAGEKVKKWFEDLEMEAIRRAESIGNAFRGEFDEIEFDMAQLEKRPDQSAQVRAFGVEGSGSNPQLSRMERLEREQLESNKRQESALSRSQGILREMLAELAGSGRINTVNF